MIVQGLVYILRTESDFDTLARPFLLGHPFYVRAAFTDIKSQVIHPNSANRDVFLD